MTNDRQEIIDRLRDMISVNPHIILLTAAANMLAADQESLTGLANAADRLSNEVQRLTKRVAELEQELVQQRWPREHRDSLLADKEPDA